MMMMASLPFLISPPILCSYSSTSKVCFLCTKSPFPTRAKVGSFGKNGLATISGGSFLEVGFQKDGILMRKERLVVVRANQGFGFNGGGGGGGGGGGWDKRILGNLALAVGLTYLSMTDQLGWVLDAIVSVWLLAVLLPIVGLVAFFWYAGRQLVQSSCPNCGNDVQILKSSVKDGVQLCPYCTQPISVQGNKFVRESAKFSSGRSTTAGQVFNGFSRSSGKGKASSAAIVDVEAEVKDID
ncbi:uncharacterized protein M6B38_360850 [Iris pallida]|uniref:Uncharacterized protein n=1 Tax=Iris pallida TaxID=29817 RepID=A0AAX6GJN8_IRIPA|nr:uncharacterized protein M6B38_360850 [Iris pallida]